MSNWGLICKNLWYQIKTENDTKYGEGTNHNKLKYLYIGKKLGFTRTTWKPNKDYTSTKIKIIFVKTGSENHVYVRKDNLYLDSYLNDRVSNIQKLKSLWLYKIIAPKWLN